MSLSRLNHRLPRREAHPEVMQGTAQFHHEITDARLPQPDPVFDDATTLDTAVAMLDPEPAVVPGRAWQQQCQALRSEEHTSELQSRFDLVCRLLLEKK